MDSDQQRWLTIGGRTIGPGVAGEIEGSDS